MKKERISDSLSALIANAIIIFLGGLFTKVVWNTIAWECNLPQFGYWFFVCAIGVLYTFVWFISKLWK